MKCQGGYNCSNKATTKRDYHPICSKCAKGYDAAMKAPIDFDDELMALINKLR